MEVTGSKAGYESATKASAPVTARALPAFSDIPEQNMFFREISWLASEGISTGWTESDGSRTYRPLETVKRDAMAAFLYRLAGRPDFTPPSESPFSDVPRTNMYYKEIAWLADQRISTGYAEADGRRTFRPLDPVNRDAMAAFMYRFDKSPAYEPPAAASFADVQSSNQFYKEISWLAARGVSTGWPEADGSRTYRPLQPVARDAMAAFMYRLMKN